MSDWIEHDGKKYFEESYLKLANANTKRAAQAADREARKACAEIAARYRTNSGAAIAEAIRATISEVKR